MAFTPFNFVFSLHLEPIYEWETVDPEAAAAEASKIAVTPPADLQDQDCLSQTQPDETPLSKRLIFKGYEWRPTADCLTFPREGWESAIAGFEDVSDASGDADAARRRQEELARDRKAVPVTPAPSAAPLADEATDEPDPT